MRPDACVFLSILVRKLSAIGTIRCRRLKRGGVGGGSGGGGGGGLQNDTVFSPSVTTANRPNGQA